MRKFYILSREKLTELNIFEILESFANARVRDFRFKEIKNSGYLYVVDFWAY
jgi:hypothetical protein